MNFQVTFYLDGCGIYYDPHEPIHFDDVLCAILAPLQGKFKALARDDEPDDIQLPLLRSTLHGSKIWHASALFPDGEGFETLQYWRKKWREYRQHLTSGSPNLRNGPYREYNMPMPLLVVPRMIAYASGNCKEVKRVLRKHLRALGKYRGKGKGRVVSIDCEHIQEDWSLVKDGRAMRYLPSPDGIRKVRPAPPYWNNVGRIKCCEVGENYII